MSWLPTDFITGWSEDGTDVTFPIASIPELTAAEADAATGDMRKVLFALLEQINTAWAAIEVANRPSQMTIYKSSSINPTTNAITHTYSVRFNMDVGAQEVSDEPS